MVTTLDYPAFVSATKQINCYDGIPEELPNEWKNDESFVKKVFNFKNYLKFLQKKQK